MPLRFMDEAVTTCITKDSLRPNKRLKLINGSFVTQEHVKEEDPVTTSYDEQTQDDSQTEDKPKQKRNWKSWGVNDINIFFDGLSEYGKDFDKIHAFMKHKLRNEAKNKDQIRHFYYRTWNKISKSLSAQPEKDKRAAFELFVLMCYGELRKKEVKGFGKKQMKKVDELVTQGYTFVRYKGRNSKLKPPNCKALKKLQENDAMKERATPPQSKPSVPKNLSVELKPASNITWTLMQRKACNPRLRFAMVHPKTKLIDLIDVIKKRLKRGDSGDETPHVTISPADATDIDTTYLKADQQDGDQEGDSTAVKKCSLTDIFRDSLHLHRAQNSKRPDLTNDGVCILNNENKDNVITASSRAPRTPTEVTTPLPENDISEKASDTATKPEIDVTKNDNQSKTNLSWTIDSCEHLSIQSLYFAFGRPEIIKLQYNCEDHLSTPVNEDELTTDGQKIIDEAFKRLISLVSAEVKQLCTPSKRGKVSKKVATPQPIQQNASNFVPVCSSADTNSPGTRALPVKQSPNSMLPPKDINLPALRKRGRNPNLKPVNIVRRKLIPKPINSSDSKSLVQGAVAVNIVPQPAQLVQFAQVPPVSAQLMNSGNTNNANPLTTSATLQQVKKMPAVTSTTDILSKAMAQTLHGINPAVQVLDEGFAGFASSNENSNLIQLAHLINMHQEQESGSQTSWTNMLSDVDLSFLQASSSNQGLLHANTSRPLNTHTTTNTFDVRNDITVAPALASESNKLSFSGVIGTRASPAVFVSPEQSSMSFTDLNAAREETPVSSTLGPYPTSSNTQCKLAVLTTPVKDSLKTPTKLDSSKDNNALSVRIPSPSFESNSWLTGEVADISLSGIIGEITKEQKIQAGNNVSTAMDCMLDDNSVDFVNRFKDLAAKVATNLDTNLSAELTKRVLSFKEGNLHGGLASGTGGTYEQIMQGANDLAQATKDIPMPIYHAEESTGPLDGLSFVLPTTDSGNSLDSVKCFSVGQ